ncbi:MAG: YveK family protein [Candidatus Promineifilaceae bacterium]
MEFRDYARILRQRGWLILLLAGLTAAAAFGFSKLQDPVYEASLRLLVQPARTDFGQAQAARSLLRGYVQWIQSSYQAAQVIDQLQLDMTPQQLMGDVEVASDESSYIIQIIVENSNQGLASDIAMAWGNLFVQFRLDENADQRREDQVEALIIDDPQIRLARPQTQVNTAAGFVFGALIGVLLVLGLEWLESGVMRRSQDVERYLDIPVVGTIPK